MNRRKIKAIIYAVMAAVFYAINMPLSKLLLAKVEPAFIASFLYFGAGIGIGMIALDIAAPILLMLGLMSSTSSSASLLKFSWGSVLVLAATVYWGLENNFTRKISSNMRSLRLRERYFRS